MEHHFNVQMASRYGVNEAIFCHNLYFWIKKNQANKKHIYDENIWTYNTMEAFTTLFPYWTVKQLRTVITNSENKGLIIKGNYNLKGYDRTLWYALTDVVFEIYEGKPLDKSHLPKRANESQKDLPKRADHLPNRADAFAQKGRPIPDSKLTDNKLTDNSLDLEAAAISKINIELKELNKNVPIEEISEKLIKDIKEGKVKASTDKQYKGLLKKRIEFHIRETEKIKINIKASKISKNKPIRTELLPDFYDEHQKNAAKYTGRKLSQEEDAEAEEYLKRITGKI